MSFLERNILAWIALISLFLMGCGAYYAWFPKKGDELTSPKVVELIPSQGIRHTDPKLDKLVVRFDRPMRKGSSLTIQGGKTGIVAGESYWNTPTEFVIPVELEENMSYTIWLNHEKNISFMDNLGYALVPYRWEFATGPAR